MFVVRIFSLPAEFFDSYLLYATRAKSQAVWTYYDYLQTNDKSFVDRDEWNKKIKEREQQRKDGGH